MSETKLPIVLRRANPNDVSFIFNSWLRSFRHSSFAHSISNTVYFAEHHKVLERLVRSNEVIIAASKEDESQIFGYICAGRVQGIFVIHYIYVKHTYRNMGIGRSLLNSFQHDPTTAGMYTHHTRMSEKLAPKYNMVYSPYLALTQEYITTSTAQPRTEIEVKSKIDEE